MRPSEGVARVATGQQTVAWPTCSLPRRATPGNARRAVLVRCLTLAGIAQTGGNPRHRHQQRLFHGAALGPILLPRACQQFGL